MVEPRSGASLRMAIVYPNTYAVGMSNLGLHTVYRLANAHPGVRCERAFLPEAADLRAAGRGARVVSIESQTPLGDFDLVAFSAAFENDYINLVALLDLAGLPLRACDRNERYPVVVMGGAAVSINPEPVAPFLDICAVGEGEELLAPLLDACLAAPSRDHLFATLASTPGFYVPRFYTPSYARGPGGGPRRFAGLQASEPALEIVTKVRAALDRPERVAVTAIHTPDTEFGDRVITEVARGCTKGCRYCWVGYSILPFRVHDVDDVIAAVRPWRSHLDRVGLVATALLDHPEIETIASELRAQNFRVFSPSLIISTLREPLLRTVLESGQQTITIAPEAGSDRMRQLIMKKISNEEILAKARMIFRLGAVNLKNYIIIGLPGESEEDLQAIIDLGTEMRRIMVEEGRARGRIGTVTLSINCLIPKPGTPLQWAAQLPAAAYRRKLRWLRKRAAAIPNLVIDAMPVRAAEIQAVMSRGDRRVADLLESWYRSGDWSAALAAWSREHDLPLEEILRERDPHEPSPWDHLRVGPGMPSLHNQWDKAMHIAGSTPRPAASAP